jgi:hypothetical protein
MTPHTEKIAAIAGDDGATAQALLIEMAAQWRAHGAKIIGVTAESHGLPGRTCGAGFLREIASGRAHTIYLDAPSSDTSCHLDAAGVADAGTGIIKQIPTSDLVILNKFGKLEATGKGLAAAFAAANCRRQAAAHHRVGEASRRVVQLCTRRHLSEPRESDPAGLVARREGRAAAGAAAQRFSIFVCPALIRSHETMARRGNIGLAWHGCCSNRRQAWMT